MLGLPPTTQVKRSLPKAQLFKRFDWTPLQRERFDGVVSRLDFVNWISPRTVPAIAVGHEVNEIFVVVVSLKSRDFDTKAITLLAKSIPQRIIYVLRYEDEICLAVCYGKLFVTNWQSLTHDSPRLILKGLNLDAVWENIVRQIANIPNIGPLITGLQMTNVGTSLCDVSNPLAQACRVAAPADAPQPKHAEGMSLQGIDAPETDTRIITPITGLQMTNVGTSLCDVSNPLTQVCHIAAHADVPQPKHAEGMSLQEQIKFIEERDKVARRIEILERQMKTAKQPRRKRELFVELQKLKSRL